MRAALSPLQTHFLVGEDSAIHRSYPVLQCAAFAGLAGSAFLFLPCPSFSQRFLSEWGQRWFSPAWGSPLPLSLPTNGSHGSNRAGNPFRWCHFPTLASKSQTGSHTGFSLFCSVSLPTFSLWGKAGLFSNLGCPGFARLAHNFPTRLQRGG